MPSHRAGLLTACSFLLPLILWCAVSYTPWIWHPDIKLELSADRANIATFYTAGDHVSREYFPTFVGAVRQANRLVEQQALATESPRQIKRANLKKLRHLAPIAVGNGWLTPEERVDDAKLYRVWADLAEGRKEAVRPALTPENQQIVAQNWARLRTPTGTYDYTALPERPLLSLVPQGRPANPVYLPAPHEVVQTGYRDWTTPSANDGPTMAERMRHSIKIVFGGFFLAALVGVPIGILSGIYTTCSRLFEPFIDFFRYMPAPAFGTLLVAVFMAHDAPKIALVFLGTVFQLILVVAKTTRQLDRSLLEAAQTLGARPRHLLARVVVPGILPDLYNDLRILLGWAWTWLVIAELIGVKSGLTEFIETQGRFRNFDRVYPVIIAIGLLGFFTDQILAFGRAIFFPWVGTPSRGPAKWILQGLRGVRSFFGSAIRDREMGPRRVANLSSPSVAGGGAQP